MNSEIQVKKVRLGKYTGWIFLILLSCSLGFTALQNHKLSGDEMLTLNIATGFGQSPLINNTWAISPIPPDKKIFTQNDYWAREKFSNVLKYTRDYNGNMVAYNIFLYYFIKFTCVNDGLLRGLSAFFYVISTLLVYYLAIKLVDNRYAAFIGALLFATNSFVLHMGHDMRGYSFTIMVTLLSTLVFVKLEKPEQLSTTQKISWTIILGFLYGAGLLSHYFALYVIGGHVLYALYRREKVILNVFIALLICSLFFYLWLQNGGRIGFINMGIQDKYILKATSAQTHTSFLSLIMGLLVFFNSVIGYYFQYLGYRNSQFFFLILIPCLILAFGLYSLNNSTAPKNKINVIFLLFMICFTALFLIACSIKAGHITSLLLTRFGAFVTPYISILLGYSFFVLFNSKNKVIIALSMFALVFHIGLNILCYKIPFSGYWFTYSDVKGKVTEARNKKNPPNPYSIAADSIQQCYTIGDTVVYNNIITPQYVNLYLKNSKYLIVQKIDTLLRFSAYYKIIGKSQPYNH